MKQGSIHIGKSVVNREVEAETGVLSPMVDALQRYLQQLVEKVEQAFLSAHINQTEITESRVRERHDSPPSPPLEKGRRCLLNHHSAGEAFYNASPFRLRDLTSRARQQQLTADFEAYLDGFSPNVLEVLERFKFRNQIPELAENDLLGFLLEKFLDPSINLSPKPVLNADGSVRLEALDNHGMGTVFEELIRRFNEENNEEAGEHFTGDAGQGESNIRRWIIENEQSKIFPNAAFGYWKVTVDRPLRLSVDLSPDHRERFRDACRDATE